jgi:GLPGLI family protein
MKNYLLLLLLIISSKNFSQIGVVEYEAEVITELKFDENQSKEVKNLLKKINSSKTSYLLEFFNSKSIFQKDKKLKINDKKINITEILAGKGIYYTNLEKDIILNQKEFSGREFLISLPVNKWELKQEKKKIGKYICYKATTKIIIENKMGKKELQVIAWYTPQINYNFGPKGYCKLPGLILELQENKLFFRATKIKITNELDFKIIEPKNGIKVSKVKYDSIVLSTLSNHWRYNK